MSPSPADALVSVRDLVVDYRTPAGVVQAVAGVNLDISEGETLGLVGESGCGKSTTGRAMAHIEQPTKGTITFRGTDINLLTAKELRRFRTGIQMIFQDPISSLNPRRRIGDIVAEPFDIWKWGTSAQRTERVRTMLEAVGIDYETTKDRYPAEFSGGQCQRIAIARALMLEPQLLICDEIVSALDVSIQAQILNLLHDLKERYSLTILFIAHDLAVVKNVSDRVAVMYLGKVVEVGSSQTIYESPAHHYTSALIASAVEAGVDRTPPAPLEGEPPSPLDPPSGCRFRTRCPRAEETCAALEPPLTAIAPGHQVACHFPLPQKA